LTLVGHSWGGLVATNVARELPETIRRIVLLSPFCHTERGSPLYAWFQTEVRRDCPGLFGDMSEQAIHADFEKILGAHLPSSLFRELDPRLEVKIIQAELDDTTPAAQIRALLPEFAVPPEYVELKMDHSFSQDREALARRVLAMVEQ
jgi:pimeloyl-ACP methyl ester carboxylesterase